MSHSVIDIMYMKRCIELARQGAGSVSPNPLVGAVIVKDGKVISEGWHAEYGAPHAEADAIAKAGQDLTGATIYCNLEPCCHTKKKTPPCVPAIISSGIKKVVISNVDPNPQVSGEGIKQLQDAGIEVEIGVGEEEGNELNKFFFKHIETGLPYVMLKVAQSLNGMITYEGGRQTWITGTEAGEYVHKLRSEYDAVMIGANTVLIDNPQLNVRHVQGRNPKIVVIDRDLKTPLESRIFSSDNKVILFTSDKAGKEKTALFENKDVDVIRLTVNEDNHLDLAEVLKKLGGMKIASVMVEGGAGIFSRFIEKDLYDEIVLLVASKVFGKGLNAFSFEGTKELKLKEIDKLGDDIRLVLTKA